MCQISELYELAYPGHPVRMPYLEALAVELSRIAGRAEPWTGKFLHSLLKGYKGFKVSGELARAIKVLSSHLESVGQLPPPTVEELPPGTILMYPPRTCATYGCKVIFVPGAWNQRYHSKDCRNLSRNLRRRKK